MFPLLLVTPKRGHLRSKYEGLYDYLITKNNLINLMTIRICLLYYAQNTFEGAPKLSRLS
jgi:hypothetical protein